MKYIFLHGLGQNPSSWYVTISNMEKQENITCLNLPLLLKNKEATYSNLYNALVDYCKDISEPLNLCGLSLGAVLALNYALDNPKMTKSLVLIGAQCKMPKILLKFQNLIFGFLPKASFQNLGFNKKDFIKLTSSMVALNFTNRLNDISCPTLVLCGERDKANKKASIYIAENILNAEFHFIKNSGHEVNKDAPKELSKLLDSFYKETVETNKAIV